MQSQEYVLQISTKRLIGSSFLTSAGLSLRSLSLDLKVSESETDTIYSASKSTSDSSSTDVGASIGQYDNNNSTRGSDRKSNDNHVIIKKIWDEYTYNSSNNMMSILTLHVFLYDLYYTYYTYYTHLSHMTPDKPVTSVHHTSNYTDMIIFINTVLSILNIGEDKKCISYIEFFDTINRFDIVYDK